MRRYIYFVLAGLAGGLAGPTSAGAEGAARPLVNHTEEWHYVWDHTLDDILVMGVIFAIIAVYFLTKFKRKSDDEVGSGPTFSWGQTIGWALIPAFVFMADDFYLAGMGWKLWVDQRTVPENAMEVQLKAHMWGWDFEYPNGVVSDNEEGLVVPVGQPVVMRMKSEDAVHSFFIPDYRIKEDVMPGRVTYLWFNPDKIGEHVFTCAEFCGAEHSNMYGKLKVVSKEKFEAWAQSHKG